MRQEAEGRIAGHDHVVAGCRLAGHQEIVRARRGDAEAADGLAKIGRSRRAAGQGGPCGLNREMAVPEPDRLFSPAVMTSPAVRLTE